VKKRAPPHSGGVRRATITGHIRYDPRTIDAEGEHFDPWWVIVEYPAEDLERMREQVEQELQVRLSRPRWGAHISVVSGEEPPRKQFWKHRDGELIRFEVDDALHTDGAFYWYHVRCPELHRLRAKLGLPRHPSQSFHLTLGRIKR
jgi:hypothetical protein